MNKKLILAAIACLALAGCSNEEYLGEFNPENTSQGIPNAINFSSVTPKMTRAEGEAAAAVLGNSFKVYATKTVGSTISNVFSQMEYKADDASLNIPYWVWYQSSTANTTTSNTANWEYVGTGGGVVTFEQNTPSQGIKYWDYSADHYDFVAFKANKPNENTAAASITNITTNGFTVTGSAAQLATLYVADKKVITSTDYNKVVQFNFRSSGTKVRLGIYETIPGYFVRNVKFRPYTSGEGAEFIETTGTAKLSGKFNGSSFASYGVYTVTYDASGVAQFTLKTDPNLPINSNYFDFGTFAETDVNIGETSIAPTWASGSSDYQGVLPNTDNDNVDNMILKVDYELYDQNSHETITVKGATAVVPAMYMKWNPNYAYTYLFKISDNTNGTTGPTEGTNEGLYPITFDAVTIAAEDGFEQGTITTVSTPAITTYQVNSVVDEDNTENPTLSEHGITYAHANGPIYITVNTDGTLATLTDKIKLYTVAAGTSEADLMLTTKTKTEVTADANKISVLASQEIVQGITFAAGTTAKFTPAAPAANEEVKTYAVEYEKEAAVVEAWPVATGLNAGDPTTGLYEQSGAGTTESPYVYNPTEDTTVQANKTYYTHTPASPAVYQYKIIVVSK